MVSRSLRLGVGPPFEQVIIFYISLNDNHFLSSSVICNLQCNHALVRVAQDPYPYFTVSSETPPTWGVRSPYLYPPGIGLPSFTPRHYFPFKSKSKSKLYYGRQAVGQSVLESGTHLGPTTNFSHSLFDYSYNSFGFFYVGGLLWRKLLIEYLIWHQPRRKHCAQQFFYYCLCIRCRGNVRIDPSLLPLLFRFSG
jgi:hypothetical protein